MSLEKLRVMAKEIIARDDIKYLIGWRQGTYGFRVSPHFVQNPEEAEKLIFSPICTNNPATYLTLAEKLPVLPGKEPDIRKVALMVKGCDSRAVVQLLMEKGLEREQVFIVGCPCEGVIDVKKAEKRFKNMIQPVEVDWKKDKITFYLPDGTEDVPREEILAQKCLTCRYHNPVIFDVMLGDTVANNTNDNFTDIKELEEKSPQERWSYWQMKFSSCIRCYSCRNVCPMCYCADCILDRVDPQWIFRSVNLAENTSFQLMRAYHLAGRCIECGECERVCPAKVPLMKLNRKLTKEIRDKYGFEPGVNFELKPFPASYSPKDNDDFIL